MPKNLCPRCKKQTIELYAGYLTGFYHCKKCGYLGSLIIEKD